MDGRLSQTFAGVDFSIPSKVRASEAEAEWQEVHWVPVSTGELTVDADSFLLVFKPAAGASCGKVKAKPLGSLVRSSPVQQEGDGRTLVVTTTDPLSVLCRFTFQSISDASDFSQIADQAEASHDVAADSGGLTADSAAEAATAAAESASKLEVGIRAALASNDSSRSPALVFGGAELCGPDPNFAEGGEVLLGRGAAVLLDPPETTNKVGVYELLFYSEEEAASAPPVWKTAILPKATVKRLQAADGMPEAVLQLRVPGTQVHTLSFDNMHVADAFVRDFTVRKRVGQLAFKTANRARAADDLRGEIEGMKRRSLLARVRQMCGLLFVLTFLYIVGRLSWLYKKDGAWSPAEHVSVMMEEVRSAARLFWSGGAKACRAGFSAVPAADLRRCLAAGEVASSDSLGYVVLRHCLGRLVGDSEGFSGAQQ